MIVVVVTPAVAIAIPVVIPTVIVLKPAAIPIPVPAVELAAFIARPHPRDARIRRPGPIPAMPVVAPSHGIPVAVHPIIVRTRCYRPDAHDSRPWRRTDPDSHSHLSAESRRCCK